MTTKATKCVEDEEVDWCMIEVTPEMRTAAETIIIYEHQRKIPVAGYSYLLLPGDPPAWTDQTGRRLGSKSREKMVAGDGWEWCSDWKLHGDTKDVDAEGWSYCTRFSSATGEWKSSRDGKRVRRRCWRRLRRRTSNAAEAARLLRNGEMEADRQRKELHEKHMTGRRRHKSSEKNTRVVDDTLRTVNKNKGGGKRKDPKSDRPRSSRSSGTGRNGGSGSQRDTNSKRCSSSSGSGSSSGGRSSRIIPRGNESDIFSCRNSTAFHTLSVDEDGYEAAATSSVARSSPPPHMSRDLGASSVLGMSVVLPSTVVDDFADAIKQLREEASRNASEGKWHESVKCLDRAIEADSGSAALYASRSRALCVVGQYARALTDANLCIAMGQTSAKEGYCCKGQALLHMRQFDRAAEAFRTALQCDPKDEHAKRSLQEALHRGLDRGESDVL